MIRNLLKVSSIFVLALTTFMASCTKEEAATPEFVENFTEDAIYEMQARGNCGKFGCYEFVFPLTIVFSDGTSAEVDSYETLKETIKTWKEANPEATQRPTFQFPIEVLSEEGDVISVADADELQELKRSCRRNFFDRRGPRGHMGRGTHCFTLAFPVDISFPDETTATAADHDELKALLREWRTNNRDNTERPELVFPINVTMEDGTVVTVESKEALKELKDSCGEG